MTIVIDGHTMPVRSGLDEGEVTIRSEWDAWENEEYHRKVRTIGTVRTWTINCREKNVDWSNSLVKHLKEKMRAGDVVALVIDEADRHQSGLVADTSGNGNHGVSLGAIDDENGRYGRCLRFDGQDDIVDCKDIDAVDGVSLITIAAWVRTSVTPGVSANVCRKEGVFALQITSAGKAKFWINDGAWKDSGDGTTNIADGGWHHLAGVYDGTYIRIYVDGTQENSSNIGPTTLYSNDNMVVIGGRDDHSELWKGPIDEVYLYTTDLTGAQISDLMNGDPFTGMIAEWRFETHKRNVYVLDVEVSYVWGWPTIRDFTVELQEA